MKDTARTQMRRLSEEEIALWLAVTQGVARRPGISVPKPKAAKSEKRAQHVPVASAPAPKANSRPPPPSLPGLAPLDRRARQRLARGQTPVDAAIDLHGLRQQEAHQALHRFLSRAQREGAKIVLVVTGKGETRPVGDGTDIGVLRRSVPLWLRAPEWRGIVVGFEEASRPHGGAGALYVRIRRRER